MYDVIIVGGGPAGATAALYTARANLKTLVLDKSLTSGALGVTAKIANYPGFPEVLTGAQLLKIMQDQAASFGAEFKTEQVFTVDLSGEVKKVYAAQGEYQAKAVILCTGAMGRKNRVPGEEPLWGKGISNCGTCDGAFFKDQEIAVVGDNEEALEETLFLTRYVSKVHLALPSKKVKASPETIQQVQSHPKVRWLMEWRLKQVEGKEHLESVTFLGPHGEETLQLPGLFIYLQGGQPITEFLKESGVAMDANNFIKVNHEMATNVQGVFACGDVIGHEVKQAVVAAGEGCIAALAVDKFINKRSRVIQDYK
ncbi:MAG: FAD-dependent oxidoreductase [Candidatus Omnitrophica bacterium]|nr:FAD-dependent oxidoreductase [Candidatus Omnitrophota bacterium]